MRRVAPALLVTLAAGALLCAAGVWLRAISPHSSEVEPSVASGPSPIPAAVEHAPREREGPVPPKRVSEPAVAPLFDEAGEPTEDFLRAFLEDAIAEHLPSYKLSSDQLDRLADAAFRLRDAQRALRALPPTAEHAERRRALREAVAAASADFEHVMEMTPGEFTARVETGVGIDTFSEDEEVAEPEFLDDRR